MASPILKGLKFEDLIVESPLEVILPLVAGLCWTLAYIFIIFYTAASRDKVYIPIVAFSMNIVWEFVYSFVIPVPPVQNIIDRVWFVLDCFILVFTWRNYIYSKLGTQTALDSLWYLVTQVFVGIFVNWMFVYLVTPEHSAFYCAFMINVAMSYLFIVSTQHARNFPIALFKLLGTGITSVYAYLFLVQTDFMVFSYILLLVLDSIYLGQTVASCWRQRNADKALQAKLQQLEMS